MEAPISVEAPRVFISYSHDSEKHKNWIENLATRLLSNGVNIILDQWDVTLGSDLPKFMESGLREADRVIAICTESYVAKANAGEGGTGYEKMILSAQILKDQKTNRVIPLVRDNSTASLPTFLGAPLYVDFRDGVDYEDAYSKLIHDVHGKRVKPRPAMGKNPFLKVSNFFAPQISFGAERYVSTASNGVVTFDYSNNNGRYVVGSGDYRFEMFWARAGGSSIYVLNDPPSIRTVALALEVKQIEEIDDAAIYDDSSRTRHPKLGEIVVWQNTAGYYLATQIRNIKSRAHDDRDEVTFEYVIQTNRTSSFRSVC